MYDFARTKGYVEIAGSGWRAQRADAPLVNTFRSWCDARGVAAIYVHKGQLLDEIVLDLSPLRKPADFATAAAHLIALEGAVGGEIEGEEGVAGGGNAALEKEILEQRAEAFLTEPIHRLPMYTIVWSRPRSEAKALAKQLATLLKTGQKINVKKGRVKTLGAPSIKPGKSRRHGGYGIG